ncbi:MAG: ABC transporter permease [Prolixibacteraceae bacterium]|jgi:ABC-2 type transport system permease protein|nr:ABC transporter permease [Prolixibacteraceae bacterium]
MKNYYTAILCEILKLRRSVIFSATLGFFVFIPFIIGLFIPIVQHPEILEKLGIMGTKAQLFETDTWEGYFGTLNQMNAVLSLIGYGFVVSWIFGREHLEHTITSIIALPIKRSSIVLAKFTIAFFWCAILSILMYSTSLLMGYLFDLPGWSSVILQSYTKTFLLVALLTYVITTPVAFIASFSKGIVAALAFIILTLIMAQFIVILGIGHVFPWAVPGILSVLNKQPDLQVTFTSYLLVIFTGLLGIFGTITYWHKADHQ